MVLLQMAQGNRETLTVSGTVGCRQFGVAYGAEDYYSAILPSTDYQVIAEQSRKVPVSEWDVLVNPEFLMAAHVSVNLS